MFFFYQDLSGNWVPAAEAFPLDCGLLGLDGFVIPAFHWTSRLGQVEHLELANHPGWQFSESSSCFDFLFELHMSSPGGLHSLYQTGLCKDLLLFI